MFNEEQQQIYGFNEQKQCNQIKFSKIELNNEESCSHFNNLADDQRLYFRNYEQIGDDNLFLSNQIQCSKLNLMNQNEKCCSSTFQGTIEDASDQLQKFINCFPIEPVNQRKVKVERYLLKKKNRVTCQKIRYRSRKQVAEKRIRIKGRFIKKQLASQIQMELSHKYDQVKKQQ